MKFDTTRKRCWAVLAGLWVLLSLVLATPFSENMLEDDEIAQIVFSFAFLSISPFIPLIHDWVVPRVKYRWAHGIVVTVVAGFLLLVAADAWNDGVPIVFFWWAVYAAAYWLTGNAKSEGLSLPNILKDLAWLWGILSAILTMLICMVGGLLVDREVGPNIGLLVGLTVWVFSWYRIRLGKPQLYRWRNFLYVLVVANWSGFAASFASTSGIIVGPLVLLLGIIFFVVPRPEKFSAD